MNASLLRVRQMVAKEMRQLLRDPRARVMMFLAPVIQLVVFGYAVNTDIPNTSAFVVDHDQTQASRELLDAFRATGYFRFTGVSQRSAALTSALDRGEAIIGIEIPPGFSQDLARGGPAQVQIVLDGSTSNTATVAQGYALRIIQRFARQRAASRGVASASAVEARVRAWYNPTLESRAYNVPAVMGIIILMMSLLLTALAVVREREDGTLDQLMVSPLSPVEFMVSKTLPPAMVALIDLVVISLIAVLWFEIPMHGSVFALLPAAILYILAGVAIGLLISSVSKTQQEAFMTMFLVLLPAIILSGFFYPIRSMSPVLQYLTLLNPARHFLEIVRAIFLKGEGISGLWPQYLALTLLALTTMRFAVARFAR